MPKERLFTWLDRGFWLVWAGFPLLIWSVVQAILTAPQQLAAQLPDQAACIASLPNIKFIPPEEYISSYDLIRMAKFDNL